MNGDQAQQTVEKTSNSINFLNEKTFNILMDFIQKQFKNDFFYIGKWNKAEDSDHIVSNISFGTINSEAPSKEDLQNLIREIHPSLKNVEIENFFEMTVFAKVGSDRLRKYSFQLKIPANDPNLLEQLTKKVDDVESQSQVNNELKVATQAMTTTGLFPSPRSTDAEYASRNSTQSDEADEIFGYSYRGDRREYSPPIQEYNPFGMKNNL